MGFSISWFAIKKENKNKLFEILKLNLTQETEEFPESTISTAELDTGWQILWYNKFTCPFIDEKALGEISNCFEIIRCLVEEHVMFSSSELWLNGKCKWKISHEGENGPIGLDFEGDLPNCFENIKMELEAEQKKANEDESEVDYLFEIPLKVTEEIVGFKHDEECTHLTNGHFTVLKNENASAKQNGNSKGFFRNLFGNRNKKD